MIGARRLRKVIIDPQILVRWIEPPPGAVIDCMPSDTTVAELLEALIAIRRLPSVQDQLAKLREKFWIVRRPVFTITHL